MDKVCHLLPKFKCQNMRGGGIGVMRGRKAGTETISGVSWRKTINQESGMSSFPSLKGT
jgi:hypothetical protein